MEKRCRNPGIRAGSRGQVLVELAVVMPFFLLVILGGIIDFGMVFHKRAGMNPLFYFVKIILAE